MEESKSEVTETKHVAEPTVANVQPTAQAAKAQNNTCLIVAVVLIICCCLSTVLGGIVLWATGNLFAARINTEIENNLDGLQNWEEDLKKWEEDWKNQEFPNENFNFDEEFNMGN